MAEYLPVFFDWIEVTEALNDQEKGRLIDAIVLFARGGDWQERIKGNERYLFPSFRAGIERQRKISEKRSEAGRAGGAPECNRNAIKQNQAKSSKANQTESKQPTNTNTNTSTNTNTNTSTIGVTEARKRFTPPTAEQVADYCREKGFQIDAARFVDYYTSKGWKVGQTPMKDWQAAVRNWAKRASEGSTSANPAMQFTQRDYGSTDLNALIFGR